MPAAQAWLLAGLSLVLVLVGAVYAWTTCLRTPAKVQAGSAAAFFAHGMYLREFWHALVTNVGIWLAVLFSRTETGIVESGVRRLSSSARGVAAAAAWVDQHIVDGLRWQACEIWWRIRRWHGRFLQTGDVQHYMFVILICSVILCLVVIRPLSHIFAQMLKRLVG